VTDATKADIGYMRRALEIARSAEEVPGASPIGCVIVLDGAIVGEGHNEVGIGHDPSAHAEMVSIRRACESLSRDDLRGATLYSTLQPCGMCTMASIWASIGKVVFGAGRGSVHRMYFEDRHMNTIDFIRDAYRDDMSIVGGVLEMECAGLYYGPNDDPPKDEQTNV
jgi:tRNA(adenine34) deaminase